MKYSIVVPAYNAQETLEQCLRAIFSAVLDRRDCEVIVVNDGSEDRTGEIARGFSVRLIESAKNEGRIRAREKGAREAKADKILFVDSRVMIPAHTLNTLTLLDYDPVMTGTVTSETREKSALNRILYLVRKRIYKSYGPEGRAFPSFKITRENFDGVAKGLGFFFVDKFMFLDALPEDRSRFANDDTRLLAQIVKKKEILSSKELPIVYIQRENWLQAFRHIYGRGPLFADYYLRPGMRYYRLWLALWFAGVGLATVIAFLPGGGWWAGLVIVLFFVVVSFFLSERSRDFITLFLFLPPVAFFFGLGILRGKLHQIKKRRRK